MTNCTRCGEPKDVHDAGENYACQAQPTVTFQEESRAIEEIAAEHQRQITAEGWSPEHDDEHSNGEMAKAAACYAVGQPLSLAKTGWPIWPWAARWWKPDAQRRRNLIKAGALIVAEIERLDRAMTNARDGTE